MVSWTQVAEHGIRMLAAFALALPIAWEREVATRMMGLRTLPLVAVACCAYILVGSAIVGEDPGSHGRLLSGLVAGIGFIGGGVILHSEGRDVKGLTTAATIWVAAALGISCGIGQWHIAGMTVVIALVVLVAGRHVETALHRHRQDDEERVVTESRNRD